MYGTYASPIVYTSVHTTVAQYKPDILAIQEYFFHHY